MTEKRKLLIDKLFLIILSVQTFLMGLLFIIQICRIYFGEHDDQIFTREICGKYILQILPVIIIWILMIIAAYVYFYIRNKKEKNTSRISNMAKLNNLLRITPDYSNTEEYEFIKKEDKYRKIAWIINISVLVICAIMGLCYLLNINHFNSQGDPTAQISKMTIHLLPWAIISFIGFLACVIYCELSAKKTIELVKSVIKANGKKSDQYIEDKRKNLAINIARGAISLVAVIFIIVGIVNGGAADVLQKAINICTECIGLG